MTSSPADTSAISHSAFHPSAFPSRPPPRLTDAQQRDFFEKGYLTFERAVDADRLSTLRDEILGEFERAKATGRLFSGGGTWSGHLNCFPGAISRFVFDTLEEKGIIDVARALSSAELGAPNVGCNLNLPGSHAQNDHIDGYAATPFMIINIAVVHTDLSNGAMEVIPGTHRREYKYWQLLAERPKRLRMVMSPGDVVIRTSSLWHRGMPNPSSTPRPMLALTWEDGGSKLLDPYQAHDGRITFLPNRYATDWKGRLIERAFVAAPGIATAVRAVRSFF